MRDARVTGGGGGGAVLGVAAAAGRRRRRPSARRPRTCCQDGGDAARPRRPRHGGEVHGAQPGPRRRGGPGRAVDETELLALSDDICTHPEVGYKETRSVEKLAEVLKQHGFGVEVGAGGFDTAFIARYSGGSGRPNLGVIVEYDALRGTKARSTATSTARRARSASPRRWPSPSILTQGRSCPARVTVFGTPAEELLEPSAKTTMHQAQRVRRHGRHRPQPRQHADGAAGAGLRHVLPEHRRREVHLQRRAGAPDDGVERPQRADRGDEAVRQHRRVRSNMRPEARIQGVITEGGAAPNVVPDRAQADFYIRYPDEVYLSRCASSWTTRRRRRRWPPAPR